MVEAVQAQSDRRQHSRLSGGGLVAEIRGAHYAILDISFGGLKLRGRAAAAGALVTVVVLSEDGRERAEVPARIERIEGDMSAVRFSQVTEALIRIIPSL